MTTKISKYLVSEILRFFSVLQISIPFTQGCFVQLSVVIRNKDEQFLYIHRRSPCISKNILGPLYYVNS